MKNQLDQSTKKIRRGDRVVAIAGNNKGLMGIVHSCKGDKMIVQGLNLRKKHIKKNGQTASGRIVEMEEPIHVSNLKLCVEGDAAVKLKVCISEQGDRQLVYRQGNQEKVYRSVKKSK